MFYLFSLFYPLTAFADNTGGAVTCGDGITNLTSLINFFTCLFMNTIVPLLMSLAIVGFAYGIIKYFLNPENEEGKKKGKDFMLWGLIAMFVIVSFWGIIKIFTTTFNTGNPVLPHLPENQ